MSFEPILNEFWDKVRMSLTNYTFAKLTLAKTIGDTELKNIYIRPIMQGTKMVYSVMARYKSKEEERFCSLDETFEIVKTHMNNPFLSALLFTTRNDITFKLNKKRVGSIVVAEPTFKSASELMLVLKEEAKIHLTDVDHLALGLGS
ncbi:MAG: hypothetical protein CFE21_08655 [Bacteroidetes bacterium B1(2017)]|nr:MAG: hypothetical protein CFE21_08655 [Bacteroidetes bacterium B1(2017)]